MDIILNSNLEQQLQSIAKLTEKSEQQIIIEALEKYLQSIDKPKNCYDLALELGVIGVEKEKKALNIIP